MKSKTILILFLLFLFSSCQKGLVYKEYHTFDNYTWGRFDKIRFEIPIEEDGLTADIIFTIRHITQYPYDNLPVNMILTTPSGEERIMEKDIPLKDKEGEFLGSVAGDLWDLEEVIWPKFYFTEKGKYTLEFENLIPKMGIPGLMDIGVKVKRNG